MATVTLHALTSTFPWPIFAGIRRLIQSLIIQCTPAVRGNLHTELSKIPHG